MLKNALEQWIRDTQQLQHITISFFKELYTLVGPRNCQLVLDQCPTLIGNDINECLVAEVTLKEIHAAIFQLGAQKAPGPDGLN